MTAVRSLRIGDQIVVRSQPDDTEATAREIAAVSAMEDLEDARQIRVSVDFADGGRGEMEFPPPKKVRRVVAPGEEPGGMVMVPGNDLWKWVGTNMNDPAGGSETFLITGFKRPDSPDGTVWVGLKSHVSARMFNAQCGIDLPFFFEGEER